MNRADSRSNAELLGHLRFEMLLADLLARFINLPADRVDDEIENAQRLICECVGLDLSALWYWDPDDPKTLVLAHYYRPPGGPPVPERMVASEYFPWSFREVMSGRRVVVSSFDNAPEEAARDVETWRHYGIKNNVTLPLSAGGGAPFGVISFHDMVAPREWSEALLKRLELVAQVFANAILRMRSELALRENETRRSLATEAADAGPWVLDARGERFWVTPKIMELFGLPTGDALDVERFVELVHPDDRQAVRDAMAESVQSHEMRVIEYRLVRSDGQVRWMQSRGRLCGEAEGARLMGITSDITERKQGEEVLRAGEARIASAVDIAGLGFYELGENAHVTFMDDRIRTLFGIPPEEEPHASDYWMAHIHPEDLPRVLQMSRDTLEEGAHEADAEYRYMHPSRGRLWVHHLARVQERDATGRAIRLLGVVQDITDRKNLEENMADQLQFERLLADVSTRLVSLPSHELDRETGWVLRQVLEFYHADRCTLWRTSIEKSMIKAIGVIREESVQPLPSDGDIAGRLPWTIETLVARHEPVVIRSLDELPPEARTDRETYQAFGVQSILLIPVFLGETLAFILSVSSVEGERIWPAHCIPRLRLLTEALANALTRKRAEEELRESCEAFQSLAGRLLSAQEEEHRLLARELHDDLSQRLAIISIGIGKLERLSGLVPDNVIVQLKEIGERVIELSSDVHDISRQLHPSIIEDLGLNRAIQSECDHFTQREGIRVRYKSKDVPAAIPIDTAVCLFRVVQEGLRNIAKHAKVKESNVSLTGADDRILLTIQDAGVGFDVNLPAGRPALGLTSMKERMHLIRGEFLIESTLGKGTTITVVAPLSGMPK